MTSSPVASVFPQQQQQQLPNNYHVPGTPTDTLLARHLQQHHGQQQRLHHLHLQHMTNNNQERQHGTSTPDESDESCSSSSPYKQVKHRKVGVPKFLRYLFQILDNEDPHIIAWSADGTSIQILDMVSIAHTILPKYFKHSNYASFQRQLNYFGFRKWTKSQTTICTFSHPEFLRHRPDRMARIKRKNRPDRMGTTRHKPPLAATAPSSTSPFPTTSWADAAMDPPAAIPRHGSYVDLKGMLPQGRGVGGFDGPFQDIPPLHSAGTMTHLMEQVHFITPLHQYHRPYDHIRPHNQVPPPADAAPMWYYYNPT
ncbi:hypothetical protein DYB30_000382 [Aphanomyces astaci]|uniref:HSF-type DNA-binding domain-containing protein n=1 Tax=Aphanomyces astaci TaxID=112090 RepID=A0A397DN68_APHAT|nr:hypothetical protein DYB36_005233 [Aphanomyces astaci]RHY65061.1 hypothetical protein DYB30_000382 [Aphanomyces astaci]